MKRLFINGVIRIQTCSYRVREVFNGVDKINTSITCGIPRPGEDRRHREKNHNDEKWRYEGGREGLVLR